jgi:hypothetical protein
MKPFYQAFHRSALALLFAASLIYPCSGLHCPELEIRDSDRFKSILLQRISRTPSFNLVGLPVKDTVDRLFNSKLDSLCSTRTKVVTSTVKAITYGKRVGTSRVFTSVDTLSETYSCPNTECIRDYTCRVPHSKVTGGSTSLECKCDGMIIGGGSMEGIGSCDHSVSRLGKDFAGIHFEAMENLDQIPINKYCPSDVELDPWFPIEKDSVVIRYYDEKKILMHRIPISELIH